MTNCRSLSTKSAPNIECKETDQEEEKEVTVSSTITCVELEADVVAGALCSVIRYGYSKRCRLK